MSVLDIDFTNKVEERVSLYDRWLKEKKQFDKANHITHQIYTWLYEHSTAWIMIGDAMEQHENESLYKDILTPIEIEFGKPFPRYCMKRPMVMLTYIEINLNEAHLAPAGCCAPLPPYVMKNKAVTADVIQFQGMRLRIPNFIAVHNIKRNDWPDWFLPIFENREVMLEDCELPAGKPLPLNWCFSKEDGFEWKFEFKKNQK